jgi:hypothetical protein
MSNGKQNQEFNLEARLNELNLTPAQRQQAVSAFRVASDAVEVFGAIAGAVKRIAGAMSLKPSVRA